MESRLNKQDIVKMTLQEVMKAFGVKLSELDSFFEGTELAPEQLFDDLGELDLLDENDK